MRKLRDEFRPEFLNRIDEIIVFRRLEADQLRRITELLLEETKRRAHAQDIELEVDPEAIAWLSERGHQPEFGARPLRRTIQRELDTRLSQLMLEGELSAGSKVRVQRAGDELSFETSAPQTQSASS